MDQPHYYGHELSPGHGSPWSDHPQHQPPGHHPQQSPGFHPPHQSPIHEYPSFAFPGAQQPYDPSFHPQSRPSHHQLQPLITSPWPSALATQSSCTPHHPLPPPPPPLQPSPMSGPSSAILPPPIASAAHLPPGPHGGSATTPRRTLTDADRRRMCLYHEEHPTKKQTEIGEMFGVERSTVSKVLRQKEKYLNLNDGSQSPIKKAKKYPDIERTLAKWAMNQQSKGTVVTDDVLRHQAKLWWLASGNAGDIPIKIDSPGWLEKFRQKHNLHGSKSRKGSIKSIPSPGIGSPTSPDLQSRTESPLTSETPSMGRADSSQMDGLGIRNARVPFHSQSNTSLSSAFTDGAQPFSSDTGSTAVSPDGLSSASSYFPPTIPHNAGSSNSIRSRSQTFSSNVNGDAYISPPQSAEATSPHYSAAAAAVFESPTSDMPPPPAKHHSSYPPPSMHTTKSMPTLKPKTSSISHDHHHHDANGISAQPSLSEARRGLETAMQYLKAQPSGWDATDVASLKRVMSQLRLRESGSLPGGLHRIPEQEFGRNEDDMDMAAFAPPPPQPHARSGRGAPSPMMGVSASGP